MNGERKGEGARAPGRGAARAVGNDIIPSFINNGRPVREPLAQRVRGLSL